jgi:hypothetical protein
MLVKDLRAGFLRLMLVLVLIVPFLIDWATAQARLPDVQMEVTLEPAEVIADGKSSIIVRVRVTENGEPREGDLLQSWIQVGGGIIRPEWVYTDANGEAEITFLPNPLTQYDVQDRAVLQIADIDIGHLLEVRKGIQVDIPLRVPDKSEEPKRSILG